MATNERENSGSGRSSRDGDDGEYITNPILPGFNPDPSIVRVGQDYYIATSTFEWFPGVQVHHSRDLVRWKLIGRPLSRPSQLNMIGNADSDGVWAPCLSYADNRFWLIFTDVKMRAESFKVDHNYLSTATDILGPWSDPVYLNSSGFDPSLFHDDDGRKWLVNMDWDWRPGRNRFAGILLQEYDDSQKALVGPIHRIFTGTDLGKTEGPHLYKRNAYYYLLTAEGGTGHDHAVTVARSPSILGPYQVAPNNPILTSRGFKTAELMKAGHGDLVETPDGWYLVHLCSRPIGHGVRGNDEGWSILGRETAIQKILWNDDGWPELEHGSKQPQLRVRAPDLGSHAASRNGPGGANDSDDLFEGPELPVHWQSLRGPLERERMDLSVRPGHLRLYGDEPPQSRFHQTLLARRQQAFSYEAWTALEFEPEDYKQMAGLICFYGTGKFHYLYVSCNRMAGDTAPGGSPSRVPVSETPVSERHLGILSVVGGDEHFPLAGHEIRVRSPGPVHLRATVAGPDLRFGWSENGENWNDVGPVLDMTWLSDEALGGGCFTGAFVGICCQDLSGQRRHADFSRFAYRETLSA